MGDEPMPGASPDSAPWATTELHPGQDLVAVGASLEPALVFDAYRHGIFPWFDEDTPVLWWSPDPRTILPLDGSLHVPRRLAQTQVRLFHR